MSIAWSDRPGIETHHSVGSASTPEAWFQGIQADHLGRGWTDIFYNVGIWFDGRIIEGRPFRARSGDIRALTVVFPGNYENIQLTDAQKRAWHEVRQFARSKGAGTWVGWHRQRDATACPGDNVVAWLQAGFPSPGDTGGADDMTPEQEQMLKEAHKGYVFAEAFRAAMRANNYGGAGKRGGWAVNLAEAMKVALGDAPHIDTGRRVAGVTAKIEADQFASKDHEHQDTTTTSDHDHDNTYVKLNDQREATVTVR